MPKTQWQKLKKVRKEADWLWQELIRKLHPKCEGCGQPTQVGHHFIPKSLSNALRHDPENGIGLCNACHCKWHRTIDGALYAKVVMNRGKIWIDYITEARKVMIKPSISYYQDQIEELKCLKKKI